MTRIVVGVFAALLVAGAVAAANYPQTVLAPGLQPDGGNTELVVGIGSSQPTPSPVAGVLGAGGSAKLTISGTRWATANFKIGNQPDGGIPVAQTIAFEYSRDGVNWLAAGFGAPYVVRQDAISSNPTTIPTAQSFGPSAFSPDTYDGGTWSLPLAGDTVAVRAIAASGSAGPNSITISAGQPYVPGVVVPATFYDVTSATNTALDTGTLDLSTWKSATLYAVMSSTSTGQLNAYMVDSVGNYLAWENATAFTFSSNGIGLSWYPGQFGGAGSSFGILDSIPPHRVRFNVSAVSSETGRLIVEAQR